MEENNPLNDIFSQKSKYVYDANKETLETPASGYGGAEREPKPLIEGVSVRGRQISQKDYDLLLESILKSKKDDIAIANILHNKGMRDRDIDALLAERKKKIQSSGSSEPSSVYTGYLQFPETEKLLEGKAKGDTTLTAAGIQYDIQENEYNKEVINRAAYNSFLEYKESVKDIVGDEKFETTNDMFEVLVDKDLDYQKEIEPFQNTINRVDLKIAEELGIKDVYEEALRIAGTKERLNDSWSPFSTLASTTKSVSVSKEGREAIQRVNLELKSRGIPVSTKHDTDDPVQKVREIRDKYKTKYGTDFSRVFQKNFKETIPTGYAKSPFFLKRVEDYMHMQGSSVDLNGDGRIYQRGTAVQRAGNQAMLSVAEMGADIAMVVADQINNKAFKKAAKEAKEQIANSVYLEGKVEFDDFKLNDFIHGRGGTVTGLVNKGLSLTAKSLPYMAGVAGIQKAAVKKGLTMYGSKSLAKYTASTLGMGTISAASAYSNGMGQDWFEDMSFAGKVGYSSVHGLAEGLGETASFAIFNKMIAPMFSLGREATKKTLGQFMLGGLKSYGIEASSEILAESTTAVIQSVSEILARGEDVTWEKMNDRVYEAMEAAILMTGTIKATTGAIRAPFEVQNLHIAGKLGLGYSKLRSRAIIKNLSEEYEKATDAKTKGIIGEQLAKALHRESQRNKENAEFFEIIRKKSPEDYQRLMEIADSFQDKVSKWESMEDGAAKDALGAELKADFQTKINIENKYAADAEGQIKDGSYVFPEGTPKEAISIANKIARGENLTMDEEIFYAENQAEVEDAINNKTNASLFTPFETTEGKLKPTTEITEKTGGVIDDIINNFEQLSDDLFAGFKTTKKAAITGLLSIKNAINAIKKINPDAKVFVHTSAKAFKDATGLKKLSRGYFKKGNEIHFLAPAMVSTTGYHESTHGAFLETLGKQSYDALFKEIAKTISKSGLTGGAVGQIIQNFIRGYKPESRSEEAVTEFIAMLADGKISIDIEKGILRKIAEVLGKALKFKVPVPSRTQAVQIMQDIANSLKEGTSIEQEQIESLRKRKDKGQESGDKAQNLADLGSILFEDQAEADNSAVGAGGTFTKYLKNLGVDIEELSYLDSGYFGDAYSDGKGNVVKLTTSNNELAMASAILNANGRRARGFKEGFAEIKGATIMPTAYGDVKVIVMEELDDYNEDFGSIEDLWWLMVSIANQSGQAINEFDFDERDYDDVDSEVVKAFNDLSDIKYAYNSLGIGWSADIHAGNIGFDKNGKIKAFDIQERGKTQIIGESGNLKPEITNRLAQAKDLYNAIKGVRNKEEVEKVLKESFGWTIGIDKKWRYEIEYPVLKSQFKAGTKIKGAKLSDIVNTPLFEVYPESKDIIVDINVSEDGTGRSESYYYPEQNMIEISVKRPQSVRQDLVHELQHWIQHREMMATGGSYETFFGDTQEAKELYEKIMTPLKPFVEARKMARLLDYFAEGAEITMFGGNYNDIINMSPEQVVEASEDILDEDQAEELIEFLSTLDEDILDGMIENVEEDGWWDYKGHEHMANAAFDYWGEVFRKSNSANGYQLYQSLVGEVEARNAEERSNYPVEKLRKKPLSTTEDIDRENQIIVYPQIDITLENFGDGNSIIEGKENYISPEAGKQQVITVEAPTFSLKEALEKTDGRVLIITSDNTGIGEVDGKDVMGGIGYSFLEENIRDGVGFASVDLNSVSRIKGMVQTIGKGKDVTILVMQQKPSGMLGNFYASDYLADAITKTFKNDRKQVAQQIKERLMGLASIKKSGEMNLVEEFIDGIANESTKSEAIAKAMEQMSFPLRKNIVLSILPKGYGTVGGVTKINPNARVNFSISAKLADAGFSQVNFWKKYSSPATKTDEYIEKALNGDWGYTYSGFVTSPSLDWGDDFQKNSGVTHPQFNAKIPSKETFKLDGGYQVDDAFKNLLTYGYNKDEGRYTVPPFGLNHTTSQSIFAGSFQEATQQSVLELVSKPSKDPFNQYHKLSSTPEGKAQIIGEIGAMAGGKLEINLGIARDMEAAGKSKESIFFATGWYRGVDNLWRSEINYGFIKASILRGIEDGSIDITGDYKIKLGDILDAKELYRMYPSLEEYNFSIEKIAGLTLGYHRRSESLIAISRDDYFEKSKKGGYAIKKRKGGLDGDKQYSKDFYGFMNTLYHEVQHAVQTIEGFSRGYNQTRISIDAGFSKKRTIKTATEQLKAANLLTKKLLEAKQSGLDVLEAMNELREIAGKSRSDSSISMFFDEVIDINGIKGFANSKTNIKEAVDTYKKAFEFFIKFRGSTTLQDFNDALNSAYLDGSRDLDEAEIKALNDFRTKLNPWVKKNIKVLDLIEELTSFYKKHAKSYYAFTAFGKDTIGSALTYLGRVAQGAAVNISRFSEKDYGSFLGKMKPTNFDVYQRNLGEAEARLVGNRGVTKMSKRPPLFSELHPDVSTDEIWIAPPAKIFDTIKKQEEKLAKLDKSLKDLDNQSMAQDDRNDKEADIESQKDKVNKVIDNLYKKMQDQLDVSPLPAAAKKKRGKAQLIEGTLEDNLFKIEAQEKLTQAGAENFVGSNSGIHRLFEQLRFRFADKYRPLQNLQTAIEKSKLAVERRETNFRRAEALMHGKAAEDARQFEEKLLKPLMDKMVEKGVSNEELSEYLYALHAYERNEFVKNTIDPANESGSGMTNEVANAIKEKYADQKEIMDELADMVYDITEKTRKIMLDFGLITKAQYDSFGMFENYVPLVGTAVAPTTDLFDFSDSRNTNDVSRGGGVAIFGKEYRKVSGRFSEAQSPLEAVVAQHLKTISRARKNEVLQVLLKMTQENKDPKAWEVFSEANPDMKVRVSGKGVSIFIEEETGEEYEYKLRKKFAAVAMAGNKDYVPVKVKGKNFYIKFKDGRITRILNEGGVGRTNLIVKQLSKLSRYFTKVFTSYNPEFIIANFTRDIQTAVFNQLAEQNMEFSNISGEAFVGQTIKNVFSSIGAVYNFEKGNREKMNPEMKEYYEEYLSSGAKTDWFFLLTPEEVEAKMVGYIRKTKPITDATTLRQKANVVGVKGQATLQELFNFVDVVNTSVENGIRFSAYVAARKNGISADKAAEFVKELTINFNRSGDWGSMLNTMYLFFNAAVQGSTRLMRSLVNSKKARAAAASLTAFSSIITAMNIAVGGEDEDGIPYYEKIPAYEKERFLIIMYGSKKGDYFKLPLPYGLNVFFNAGTIVSEMAFGVTSPLDAAGFFATSVFNSFSPISMSKSDSFGRSFYKSVTPTVLKPATELLLNEDYFGNRIYKEDFYFGADTPEATKFDKNTAEWAKSMAAFLNETTGGNEYEKGLVDISPDVMEYVFKFVTGGTGKFIQRTGKALTKEDVLVNDVPFARLFMSSQREAEASGRYYESRQKLLKEKNKIKGALKSGKSRTPEMKKIAILLAYQKKVQSDIKKISELEKRAMKIKDLEKREKVLDALYEKKIKVYKWFNSKYYSAMKD